MPIETIGDWERRRFAREAAEEIADVAVTTEPVTPAKVETETGTICIALLGRVTAGLGVQLLWNPLTGETFLTVALNGETETFSVPPEAAKEAFDHPYAFGASLPL